MTPARQGLAPAGGALVHVRVVEPVSLDPVAEGSAGAISGHRAGTTVGHTVDQDRSKHGLVAVGGKGTGCGAVAVGFIVREGVEEVVGKEETAEGDVRSGGLEGEVGWF